MQKVIPGILEKDTRELERKLRILEGITEWVHVDIMDGKFVSNLSFPVLALREFSAKFRFEVHLLVEHPERYLEDCSKAQANRVIFHFEATDNVSGMLTAIEKHALRSGMGINPPTEPHVVLPYREKIEAVLVLAGSPGFQGQSFTPPTLEKIRTVKSLAPSLLVGVDIGVNEETIESVFAAGADYVVVGSGIWKTSDPQVALRKLEAMIQSR